MIKTKFVYLTHHYRTSEKEKEESRIS